MDYRTLLVVGESPSVGPLIDLLHLLHRQRLIDPILIAFPGRDRFISTAHDPRTPEAATEDLTAFISGEVQRFTVCHLILADHEATGPSEALAYEAEQAITNAAALVGQELRQRVELLNVLAPAPVTETLPNRVGLEGERGDWVNVILMPEVQERSDLAAAPVRLNAEYIANVGVGLASMLSLWVGHESDDVGVAANLGLTADREHWHLFRTRSRTLSAPELPDMVLSDLTRTVLLEAERGDLTLEMISERDADRAVSTVMSTFAREHALMAVEPPPAGRREQRIITIRQFLGMILKFIASIPRRIIEEVVSWLRLLKGAVLRQLDRLVQTDELDFRFSARDPESVTTDHGVEPERRLRSAAADSNPDMWSELRDVAFGLLDGGQLPEPFRPIVDRGTTRFILPDPRYVVAAPQGAALTDPSAQIDTPLPDPATWEDNLRGVVDGLVHLMHVQHLRATEIENDLLARADEIVRRHEEELDRRRARGWIRRLLRGLWRLVRILLMVALVVAAVILLPLALPFAGAIAAGAIVVAQVMLVMAVLAWIRRILVRWFRSDHLRSDQLPEVIDLRRRAELAHLQSERLRQHGLISREWMVIIQSVIYHPFGPPTVSTGNRIRRAELHLPVSHKVEDAIISEMRLAGVVSAARRAVFDVGWLNAAYQQAMGHARREHDIRSPGTRFEPDSDRSLPGERQQAARASLRAALHSGRAMRSARHDLTRRVHQMLSTGEELPVDDGPLEDWLFTRTTDDSEPSAYLDETLRGTESAWNRSFLRLTSGGETAAMEVVRAHTIRRSHHPIPESLSPEEIDDGVQLEFTPLQFQSSVIEITRDVHERDLAFFTDTPRAVSIDLSGVEDLWRIPPEVDFGDVVELPEEERDRWGIDGTELPERDDVIGPRGPVVRTGGRGQYSFMLEVGGRPVMLADRRVRYRVRTEAAPPNASEIIRWVLQSTADVTGIEFVYDGTRSELPSTNEMTDYIFLGWAFKAEYERYEAERGFDRGTSIGIGGPHPTYDPSGHVVIEGGTAVLNAEMALPHTLGSGPNHALVLMHELGHVLNLGHVPSVTEMMHPVIMNGGPETWGPGDRRGLALVVEAAMQPRQSAA